MPHNGNTDHKANEEHTNEIVSTFRVQQESPAVADKPARRLKSESRVTQEQRKYM